MALTTTTLSSAVAIADNSIVVASATGFTSGNVILVDQEWMEVARSYSSGTTIPVLRGRTGSATAAHPVSANATVGTAAEFSTPPAQVGAAVNAPYQRVRLGKSYSLTGALDLGLPGSDTVAFLNGTTVRAMTLAPPTKDMDFDMYYIIGNGKAAHTVTIAAGIGAAGAGYTVLTFDTGGQCCVGLMAANGVWVSCPSPLSGTLTAVDVAVA